MNPKILAALLSEMNAAVTIQQGQNPILFMGPARVGKSATLNLLFGGEVHETDLGFVVHGPFKTSDRGVACTLYPQIERLEGKHLSLCDLGGFGDNRGEEEKICVSAGLRELVNASESIRGLVIVIDWSMIVDQSVEKFLRLTHDIANYLTVPSHFTEQEKKAVSFVITKVDPPGSKKVAARINYFKQNVNDNRPKNPEAGALMDLMREDNTFLICGDAKGLVPGVEQPISREEHCAYMLSHLESLPALSFSKGSLQPAVDTQSDLRKAKFYLELQKIAGQKPQSILSQLLPIENETQKLASYLVSLSEGKSSNYSIDDMSKSCSSINPSAESIPVGAFRNIIETRKNLFELRRAAQACFPDDNRHAILNQGLENLRHLQIALRFRLNTMIEAAVKRDLTTITETLLPSVQTLSSSQATSLKKLNEELTDLKNDEADGQEIRGLKTTLDAARNTVRAIESAGRPAIPAVGPEPAIPPHPGNPPVIPPKAGPFPGHLAILLGNDWHHRTHVHREGQKRHDAWQAACDAHTNSSAAWRAWSIQNAVHNQAVAAANVYDANLNAAKAAVTAAETALNDRKKLFNRDIDAKLTEIATADKDLAFLEVLLVRLTGVARGLNQILLTQHRSIAIHTYKTILHSLTPYANKLPINSLETFQKTLDELKAEELDTLALEKSAEGFSEDRVSVELSADTLQNQLEWIKENSTTVQSITLRDAPPDTSLSALSLRLSKCCALNTLVLDHVGYNEENFGDLLASLENMPELSALDLRNNSLNDAAGIQLVDYVLRHSRILDVKLGENKLSPIVISMLNTVLAFKQSEVTYLKQTNQYQSSGHFVPALYNLLFAQELLEEENPHPGYKETFSIEPLPENMKHAHFMNDLLKIYNQDDRSECGSNDHPEMADITSIASDSANPKPTILESTAAVLSAGGPSTFFHHRKARQPEKAEHAAQATYEKNINLTMCTLSF